MATDCIITLSSFSVRAKSEQIVLKPDRKCQEKNGDSGLLPSQDAAKKGADQSFISSRIFLKSALRSMKTLTISGLSLLAA